MDPTLWERYVHQVCECHGFGCEQVGPGVAGTYPTFIVQQALVRQQEIARPVVVKFFGPLFDGAASFLVERDMGRWIEEQSLSIPSPAILAEGRLDDDWQYLVFDHIEGVSIGQIRERITYEDCCLVASQIGTYIHQLHALTASLTIELPNTILPSKATYTSFLQRQSDNCITNHREWKDIPLHLHDQLADFVLPVNNLIDDSTPAHLIHADLTSDHLLGSLVNGRWQSRAIIDWGDARTGNMLYELVALHLDLFHADKQLLRICLEAYNAADFFRNDFPRKALSMVFLHQFPMPAWVYEPYQGAKSLQELAEGLFAI
jgi:hypothetical protein